MGYVRRAYHIWEQYNQDGVLAEIRNGGTIKLQQIKANSTRGRVGGKIILEG